jgi:hypothetical protein
MSEPVQPNAQVPPEIARYIEGVTPEGLQFDFLIGDWEVKGRRLKPDGSTLLEYTGRWNASYLKDKRMVIDHFSIHSPTGQEISSYVTLRTYSEVTSRWEMVGLAALTPAMNGEWYGQWRDGEMHLEASGRTPEGKLLRNKIRFFDISRGVFRWESRISVDAGASWLLSAALTASRIHELR